MAARKAWSALSRSYQKRMAKHGLTGKNWNTPAGDRLRVGARGHAKTPEHPGRAPRNPDKYGGYLEKRDDEIRQVEARKERLWGSDHKWRAARSAKNIRSNPEDGRKPNIQNMRKFLRMTDDEIELWAARVGYLAAIKDHSEIDWYWMFYH